MSCNCGCAFCGWCLVDCGRDAHPHVLQCPSSANPGSHHGTLEQFEKIQRERRRIAVQQYLESLPPEDAAQVCCVGSTGFALRNKHNLHCDVFLMNCFSRQVRAAIARDIADVGFSV